ncbi:MAG: glycine zipper 2TM domain-containing protein [Allosphingosinicella sp.]|uniref:glycine zipper 2TM domain-containing protein n=1 Tax=Allosphingosinicella sp. TaxID=2823234 RepID=UPI00393F5876
MRNITLAAAAATMAIPATLALPAPAEAQRYASYYDQRGYYNGPTWRGRDGRIYCRRPNGTTGLLIGGAAGALIGREVAGRGDRTMGAIIGGAAGALIGREVERGRARCR